MIHIHKLSCATTYLQTYYIDPQTGEQKPRSYATGFFIRANTALLLVTNWHVVTGLDPADPSLAGKPTPQFLKATVVSRKRVLTELTLPLYGNSMEPLWEEHPEGSSVDIAIYPLPFALETHFEFVDIQSAEDNVPIAESVAKDVFILGYPFSRDELENTFGEDAPFYLPVWKRGSIATEPDMRLGRHVLLIDSLSRSGMSGAPVVIAQDDKLLNLGTVANHELFTGAMRGKLEMLNALSQIDTSVLQEETAKRFRFLGVYSGTIGSTRLAEVALGKCWHVDTLRELVENARPGVMPFHAPLPNAHYDAVRARIIDGELTLSNADGELVERISIR